MPNYEYYCMKCDITVTAQFPYDKRPEMVECTHCGNPGAEYLISAPNLMVKEALPDGTKRKGWSDLKEASKLNKEMAVTKEDGNKKRIASEIRRLGVRFNK